MHVMSCNGASSFRVAPFTIIIVFDLIGLLFGVLSFSSESSPQQGVRPSLGTRSIGLAGEPGQGLVLSGGELFSFRR